MDETIRNCGAPHTIVGNSPPMQHLWRLIQGVSQHKFPVIILGECGTGKELVARAIHELSSRRLRRFVPVDCAALSPGLIESELFGHAKGAFTDAARRRIGLFEAADGGTLLLDEIGELYLTMQTKLLRVLQEREIRPVGATDRVLVDMRVVAVTNRNLESMVQTGAFRQDLYFRLNVAQITVPPLRERKSDIPHLVQAFIEKHREPKSQIDVSEAALKYCQDYHWPGNVRELESAVMRALTFRSGTVIMPLDFGLPGESIGQPKRAYELRLMKELKGDAIVRALQVTGGNRLAAALVLGIGKTTLYRKLKQGRAIAC